MSRLQTSGTVKALAAAAGLALCPAPARPAEPGSAAREEPARAEAAQNTRALFDSLRTEHDFRGLIVVEGVTMVLPYKIQNETVFPLASISKQFTAAAIFALVSDGRLSLDDTIAGLLPDVPPENGAITVRHLLTHTSGLNPEIPMGVDPSDRDAMLRAIVRRPLTSAPGSRWNYANSGYVLLAGIVEHVGGEAFSRVVEREVLAPIGMTSTFFYGDPRLAQLLDEPERVFYRRTARFFGDRYLRRQLGWGTIGASGMVSTPDDLLRWYEALRTAADPVAEYAAELRVSAPHGYSACGVHISNLPNGRPVAFHSGLDLMGNRAFLLSSLDGPGAAIIYTDDGNIPAAISRAASLTLVGETPVRPEFETLRSRCGAYRTAAGDSFKLESAYDGDGQYVYVLTEPAASVLETLAVPSNQQLAELCEQLTDRAESAVRSLEVAEEEALAADLFLLRAHRDALGEFISSNAANRTAAATVLGTVPLDDGLAYETRIQVPLQEGHAEFVLLWAASNDKAGYQIQAAGSPEAIYGRGSERARSPMNMRLYPCESGDAYAFDRRTYAPAVRVHFTTAPGGGELAEIYTSRGMLSAKKVN